MMTERRQMRMGDWLAGAVNLCIGVFLGIAADALVKLATSELWPLAVIIPLCFGAWFWCVILMEKGLNRLLPSGIRPARRPKQKRPAPWPRLLSLPVGVLMGVVLARLGLAEPLLRLLP